MALIGIAAAFSPLQALLNSRLGQALGHPFLSTSVNFLVGFLFMFVILLIVRPPLPSIETVHTIPWWAWCGGMFGAVFVTCSLISVAHLGPALLFATIIATQLTVSLLLDHFGILVNEQHSLNIWRIAGAGCMILGVFLIQKF